jgi:protein tyrosine phosphatase (PTP) superfamily phosphohydrolase (DUF442 family)
VGVEGIFNYRRLSEQVATGGQPTTAELRAVAHAGDAVGSNLAMPDDEDHLPDERGTVERLGMTYEPIPVVWEQPTRDDLDAFCAAMVRYAGRRVFVHCVANFRVSSFMYLYRVNVLGWLPEQALPDLQAIWEPYDGWQAFIDRMAVEGAGDG